MPRYKRDHGPISAPAPANDGVLHRLSAEPWAGRIDPKPPSQTVKDTLDHNQERIRLLTHYSALQAMPIMLARGEQTSLHKEEQRLRETIAELIRRAIDDGGGHEQDNCGIFNIEVMIGEQRGETFSNRNKNLYVIDIDISIPLEYTNLEIPAHQYIKVKKIAEEWFKE